MVYLITSKEKHSLTRKLVGYIGIGGNGGVKRKGTRFWEKKNETKILYLARVNVTKFIGVGAALIVGGPKSYYSSIFTVHGDR